MVHRRVFISSAAAALGLAVWDNKTLEASTAYVNSNSKPSELKITDLRIAIITKAPMTDPIIRIDTNQGIYGLGEVRDGASPTYALLLKSRILGENPCNVDKLFRNGEPQAGSIERATHFTQLSLG